MKVSVIIPVYNKAPFLAECMTSVLDDAHPDLEVVAVDDRSTDDSLERLKAMTDPRLRVFQMERNGGPAAAAQRAIDEARGEYLVRLDADDINLPGRIAKQVAFMDAHPEVDASGGQVQLFGDSEGVWKYPLTDDECRARLPFGVPVPQGASILRAATLRRHNVRYERDWPRYGEDWLFWARLSAVGRFANLDEPLIRYRRGEQNSGTGRDRIHDHEVLFRLVFHELGLPDPSARMDLQLWTIRMFKHPPKAADVTAFRAWLDELLAFNQAARRFPEPAFSTNVERIWQDTFHYLADRGLGPALRHMALSGRWSPSLLNYLARTRLSKWRQRA